MISNELFGGMVAAAGLAGALYSGIQFEERFESSIEVAASTGDVQAAETHKKKASEAIFMLVSASALTASGVSIVTRG